LRLKCTKFDFRQGCAPDPAGVAYSAPVPLAVFKGLLLKGGRRRERGAEGTEGRRREKRREGKRRGGKGKRRTRREEEVKGFAGPMSNCFLHACDRRAVCRPRRQKNASLKFTIRVRNMFSNLSVNLILYLSDCHCIVV